MTGAKLLSAAVSRNSVGTVQVRFKWLSPGGLKWDGLRLYPTLSQALDNLEWLYAEQRQADLLPDPRCFHPEVTTRWVDGKRESRCDRCNTKLEMFT